MKSHARLHQIMTLDVSCSNAKDTNLLTTPIHIQMMADSFLMQNIRPPIATKLYYKNCVRDTLRNPLIIKMILIAI
nr:hypothetical protein [uncultured Prevotella sp.]